MARPDGTTAGLGAALITANVKQFWDGVALRRNWADYILPKRTPEEFDAEGKAQAEFIRGLFVDFGGHVVDYGCGIGRISKHMAQYASRMTGLDGCEAFIRTARQRDAKTTYVLVEDFEEITTADFVYCVSVMQHNTMLNARAIMKHVLLLLKRGGRCFITFAHGRVYRESGFIHKYSESEVLALAAGFADVEILKGNLFRYGGYSVPEGETNELFLVARK